ncbi:MAG: hypothetical protein NUW01_02400 [Gemmatimonadaceae bacterium]|nr:hypothetical protein [Gemmatimonadaceae bacterium]
MRPLVILAAALPLVFGCAQRSAMKSSALPKDGSLQVRLLTPSLDRMSLDYVLSEPAYVAIFAVTPRHGISLVFPYSMHQVDRPSKQGVNQLWPYRTSGRAYYIIASRYPLPLEGILQSRSLLRRLVGEEAFRATNLSDTWDALNTVIVGTLPDQAWASSASAYRTVASFRLGDPLTAGRQAFFSQLFSYGRSYR